GGRNGRLDRLDLAEAHADVALAAQLLARVEQLAALDDEVELVVRAHRGAHRGGHGAGGKNTAHSGDKTPAAMRSHRCLLPEKNRAASMAAPACRVNKSRAPCYN